MHIFKLKTVNLQAAAESSNFRQLLDGDKVCTDVHTPSVNQDIPNELLP